MFDKAQWHEELVTLRHAVEERIFATTGIGLTVSFPVPPDDRPPHPTRAEGAMSTLHPQLYHRRVGVEPAGLFDAGAVLVACELQPLAAVEGSGR